MIHDFNPIAINWNGVVLSWYWLSYIAGFWWVVFLGLKLLPHSPSVTRRDFLFFMQWGLPLMLIGGRAFYVLFYHPSFFIENPSFIHQFWRGGMSFHGALTALVLWSWWCSRKLNGPFTLYTDILSLCLPLPLMLGRLANFINGELYGRVTDLPWAMIFPLDPEALARHPSQIYQALTEGLLLGVFLWCKRSQLKNPGNLTLLFGVGYGSLRFLTEFTREPDPQLGLIGPFSLGQYLCLGMIGITIIAVKKYGRERIKT